MYYSILKKLKVSKFLRYFEVGQHAWMSAVLHVDNAWL